MRQRRPKLAPTARILAGAFAVLGGAIALGVLAAAVVRAPEAGTAAEEPPRSEPHRYVALGDSLATGGGTRDPDSMGYVVLVADGLAFEGVRPRLVNVAVSGATSSSLVEDGQLTAALEALRAADGPVAAITIDIGGNDVARLAPFCAEGLTQLCTSSARAVLLEVALNLETTLAALREAAPATPIAAMTFYNALRHPRCALHASAEAGDAVLEGAPELGLPLGLNDVIRDVAGRYGVRVVEVGDALGRDGTHPDCLHADETGHALIAERFLEVLAAD